MTCPECGGVLTLLLDDELLGERGAYDAACPACPFTMYVPAEATARTRIGKLREISRSGMCARVDGYLVDIQTAGVLVAVYEALSPASRERFGKPPLDKLAAFGWKHAVRA